MIVATSAFRSRLIITIIFEFIYCLSLCSSVRKPTKQLPVVYKPLFCYEDRACYPFKSGIQYVRYVRPIHFFHGRLLSG